MSRIIPIYDISDLKEVKYHPFEWNGYIGKDNINYYCEIAKRRCGCEKQIQHLEISRNSPSNFGKKIRTASLSFEINNKKYSSESIYQGSKVFARSGKQNHIYNIDGNSALKEKAKWKGRKIVGVDLFGNKFPTESLTDLHDLVYWLGLIETVADLKNTLDKLNQHGVWYFTDCFDSIGKNSQSRSFANYFWRFRRNEKVWDFLTDNQQKMLEILKNE